MEIWWDPHRIRENYNRVWAGHCSRRAKTDTELTLSKTKDGWLNIYAQNTFSRLLVVILLKEVPKNKTNSFIHSDLNKNRHSCCSRVACALDIVNGMMHVFCHLIWKAPLSSRSRTSQHYVLREDKLGQVEQVSLIFFKTIKFSTFPLMFVNKLKCQIVIVDSNNLSNLQPKFFVQTSIVTRYNQWREKAFPPSPDATFRTALPETRRH